MTDSKKNSKFTSDVQQAQVASALALLENLSTKSSDSGLSEDTCWELFGGPCPEALRKKIKYLDQITSLKEEEKGDEEEEIIIISKENLQEKEETTVDKGEKENVDNVTKELQEKSSKDDNMNNRYNEMTMYDRKEGQLFELDKLSKENSNLFRNSEISDRKRTSQEKSKRDLQEINYLPENEQPVGYRQSVENKIEKNIERSSKDANDKSHKFEEKGITGQHNVSIENQSSQESRLSWESHKIRLDKINMFEERTDSNTMKDGLSKENRENISSEKSKIYDNTATSKDRLASNTLNKEVRENKNLDKINSRVYEKLPNNSFERSSKIASLGKVTSKNNSNEEKTSYQSKISKQNSLPNESYTKNNISNESNEHSNNEINNNDKRLENKEKHTTNASNVESKEKETKELNKEDNDTSKLDHKSLAIVGVNGVKTSVNEISRLSPKMNGISNNLYDSRVSNDRKTSLTKYTITSANKIGSIEGKNEKMASETLLKRNSNGKTNLDEKYLAKVSNKGLKSIEETLLSKQSTTKLEKKSTSNQLYKNRVSNDHRTSVTRNGNTLTEDSITKKKSKQYQQRSESVSISTTTLQQETAVKAPDLKTNAEIYARNLGKPKSQSVSIGTASSLIQAGMSKVSRNDESLEKPPINISTRSEEKELTGSTLQQSSTSTTNETSGSNADQKKIREKNSKRVSTSTSDSYIFSSKDASSLSDNNYKPKFKNCNCVCCVERQIRKSYKKEKNQCECCKKKPTQCHHRDNLEDNKNFQIKIFENNPSSKPPDNEKITIFNENKILCNKKMQTSEITLITEDKNQIPCPYIHNIEQLLLNSGYLQPAYPDQSRRPLLTKRDQINKKDCGCSGDSKQQSVQISKSAEDRDSNENSRSPSKCSHQCDIKNNEEYLSLADSLKNALLRRTVKNTVKKFENKNKYSLFMCSDTSVEMEYQQPKYKPKNFMHKGEIHLPIPKSEMCECCHKPKQMVRKRPNVPTANPFICCNHRQYY